MLFAICTDNSSIYKQVFVNFEGLWPSNLHLWRYNSKTVYANVERVLNTFIHGLSKPDSKVIMYSSFELIDPWSINIKRQ